MDIRKFSQKIIDVTPSIQAMFLKGLPDILKGGKVTFPQIMILEMLRMKKACKMSDVAKALGVTKSAVTGLVDRLIKSGLVRRERLELDRRIVRVSLTPKGAKLSNAMHNHKLKIISRIFSCISKPERAQYLRILEKVQKKITEKK